ncbi:hypothetical protein LIER_42882 [Lithospermum erythrorhizon]|uniref:Dof zinc finger protein n=1 Tax=Lithospermum erythrorhizon TaxID=34254 RepID=A0AAV3P7B4_LITER
MPLEASEKKGAKQTHNGVPPPEPEQLPCPRCESTNTKFCYYNNYNFSQPRHFCKACRRYWTHGGTLRDIPFGGGSRKNAKRSRICVPPTIISPSNTIPIASPTPLLGSALPFMVDGKGGMSMCGSFTSLLNIQGPTRLLGLGEFDQMGYGIGRATWPFAGFGDGGVSGGTMGANTWQLDGCQGGFTM